MKFSDDMRFPHPVLTPHTGDFLEGSFEVDLSVEEVIETGKVSLHYDITLTEPSLRELVEAGTATIGAFIRCGDTYYSDVRKFGWPTGSIEFETGTLLNRVTVRPIIWLVEALPDWTPSDVHAEFGLPLSLDAGAIVAIDGEYLLNVGQAKLAPLESIFSLVASKEQPEGLLSVKLEAERITIQAGEQTYLMVNAVRGNGVAGKAAALGSIYVPAVMEVLDALRANPDAYEGRRWKQPFQAKCDLAGIDFDASLFDSAQTLLEQPVIALKHISGA